MAFEQLHGGRGWLVRGIDRDALTGEISDEANLTRRGLSEAASRGVVETGHWDEVHVMPVDDIEDHLFSGECDCGIRIKYHGSRLIIHGSWDGREALEWAEHILNQPPYSS